MIISLPYPDRILSPNGRGHWATVARAKKKAREGASWATISEAGSKAKLAPYAAQERVDVALWFYPPDNRRRDADNALASMKAALDGIADALGIDDSRFVIVPRMMASDGNARVEVVL